MTDPWDEAPNFNDYGSVMWEEFMAERDRWLEKVKTEHEARIYRYRKTIDELQPKAEKWDYLFKDTPDILQNASKAHDKLSAIKKELLHHYDARWAVFADETVANIKKILEDEE